ncbi:MAG: methyl-accepting chemotaxis protein, partial [Limnochordia bacterium]
LVERISNLDLTFEEDHEAVEYIKRKDEIGTTARALAAMQKNLMEVIKVLQEVGHRIASTSETLAASSEENSATIEEIASSVDSFSQGIGATKERADVMRKDADIIENLALEGSQQMDATKGSMDKIVEASNAVKVSLGELASGVKNMEGILNMISDVADQTNLLALNAAIEAARAGEHGRGFAVVAEEIRQLAEQTQSSVGDITRMINQLVSDVNLSLETMENAEKEITGGSETLVKTQEDFLAITERIAATVKGIEEIAQSIDSMNQTSESIAAASEEQAASMQEVARNTETLAQMGAELREIVNRFRL